MASGLVVRYSSLMRTLSFLALIVFGAACGDVLEKPKDTCESAAQCTDPAAPFCVNQSCQAACAVSADCTSPDLGVCASDGACVECVMSTDCDAAAPICDSADRACRGCEKDSECPGGVCIEADGTCAADVEVSFVTMMGADSGTCTRSAPCATIPYAITNAGPRRIVHVLGGSLFTPTVTLSSDRILDGEDTSLGAGTQSSTIVVMPPAKVTVEGFRINAPAMPTVPAVSATGQSRLRLYNMQISGDGGLAVNATNGANLQLLHSHVGAISIANPMRVNCPNSIAVISQNTLEMTIVGDAGTACDLTVSRNRFESSRDGSVQLSSGLLVMENNLIIHRDGFNDSISLGNLGTGSTVRFNTLINTTAVGSDGAALSCGTGVVVTSNVFAYNSGHPITGTCETRYSVFDDRAVNSAGTGNQAVGIDTIFVNRAGGDYHLSATSAAKGNAEPGLNMVKVDFEGNPRPNPAGGPADSGALEAP